MTKITESSIEAMMIELLEQQGYSYIYAPDIAPKFLRRNFGDTHLIYCFYTPIYDCV